MINSSMKDEIAKMRSSLNEKKWFDWYSVRNKAMKKKIKIKVKSPTIYWSILKTFKIGSVRKKDLNLYY